MCTLILGYEAGEGSGLWVAANRDERYGRPAIPPFLWPKSKIRILAPRDELAGGTWIGFNAEGVFAGITNRFGAMAIPDSPSRGDLVLRALECQSADEARAFFQAFETHLYSGFNLVVVDRRSAFVMESEGSIRELRTLGAGIHIVTERSFGKGGEPREARVRSGIADPLDMDDMRQLLSIHSEGFGDGTCVHLDELDYGTRSSMIVRLDDSWSIESAHFAEGHPCRASFRDVSGLFSSLDPRYFSGFP